MKKKKIIKDVSINLIASFICTFALNFIVYPILARKMQEVEYGEVLTVLGVINLAWSVIGNCLNNTRLVLNKSNSVTNENGNYNPMIITSSTLGAAIGILIISFIIPNNHITLLLVFFTIVVGILRQYYIVSYRLTLNYNKQLITNIIVAIGYVIGIGLVVKNSLWPLSLLLGELIALIYTIVTTPLVKEPFCLTKDFKTIIKVYTDLFASSVLGNIIAYFDRFLINPILGASSVASYSVAAFWGKSLAPFIAPTANVMLSYLSQKGSKISLRRYITLFLLGFVPVVLFGVLGFFIAPWITGLLYPTLIEDALQYIIIASFGSLLAASTNLLMPIILTVCNSRIIFIITAIHFMFYLIIAFLGARTGGLMGFCVATFIISLIKVCLYFFAGLIMIKKNDIETNYEKPMMM